jgi:hypothetical protein
VFPYTWGKYELTLSQRSTLLMDDNNKIKGAMVEFGIRLEGVETFPQLDTAIRHLKEKY